MKLLDTTVAVDFLRRRDAAVALIRTVTESEWLGASEVTRFEILSGTREGEGQAIERFFSELGWVPVEETISRRAAALARQYRPAFGGVEDTDYLIAATALELGAELLTTNVRHFPMLTGLGAAY